MFWAACLYFYSPNIRLQKDKFSRQYFKKINWFLKGYHAEKKKKKWKKADASFNQTFIEKQIKFNHITNQQSLMVKTTLKLLILKTILLKTFIMKDMNSTFNAISNPFSLFNLNINSLFFVLMNGKASYQSQKKIEIIGISETRF